MKNKFRRFWRWLWNDKWEVRRACWPYDEGYCVYNPGRRTFLEVHSNRDHAQLACDELNAKMV